jgi:hypothetical protein
MRRRMLRFIDIRDAEDYLEHVLGHGRSPLRDIPDDQLETPGFPSPWQTRYSIDAMLEHAVMHPIRHAFQLDELMRGCGNPSHLRARSRSFVKHTCGFSKLTGLRRYFWFQTDEKSEALQTSG